jgi:hypothetical protein
MGAAKSSMAVHTAPDWDTSANRPGSVGVVPKVALSPMSVRMTPNAPGPTTRMLRFLAAVNTSRRHARAPATSVASGVDITTAARTCVVIAPKRPGIDAAGAVITTSSTGLPIAATLA